MQTLAFMMLPAWWGVGNTYIAVKMQRPVSLSAVSVLQQSVVRCSYSHTMQSVKTNKWVHVYAMHEHSVYTTRDLHRRNLLLQHVFWTQLDRKVPGLGTSCMPHPDCR